MSIAEKLALNDVALRESIQSFHSMCETVDATEVYNDSNFHQNVAHSTDLQNLTLYQLNAKLEEAETASKYLNSLWLIRALIQEINSLFDPVGEGSQYTCDKNELLAVYENLKKLNGKIDEIGGENLSINFALKTCYNELVDRLMEKLVEMFSRFFPSPHDDLHHTIVFKVHVNEISMSLKEFQSFFAEVENHFSRSDISDLLKNLRLVWDKKILDMLIKRQGFILVIEEGSAVTLELTKPGSLRRSLTNLYFKSLRHFILFVNLLDNRAFKNYYSTKISNDMVQAVSENIRLFMNNKEQLREELVETLQLLASSGWSVPIRNTFSSLDKIDQGLQNIYNSWVVDKYINEAREVFNADDFESHFKNLKDASYETKREESSKGEEQWDDWGSDSESETESNHDDWGSGERSSEVEKSEKNGNNTDGDDEEDAWDDWDDGWDDETDERANKTEKKSFTSKTTTLGPETNLSPPTIKYTSIPFKLSVVIAKFMKESNNGDPQDILDAIASLALLSYPKLTCLFLLFNDLKRIKTSSTYLSDFADQEWNHTRQNVFDDVTHVLGTIDYGNEDLDDEHDLFEVKSKLDQYRKIINDLFLQDLESTNSEMFKIFITELMNFTNNLILENILSNKEISEAQSEKYTNVLQGLQSIAEEVLQRTKQDFTELASYNKLKQAIILLNNHLKEIMDYFYQGELYDFTTEELIHVIKSVFVPSDLRENCIGDIIEIRNS